MKVSGLPRATGPTSAPTGRGVCSSYTPFRTLTPRAGPETCAVLAARHLFRKGLDAVGDRVSYVLLGDYAGNVAATRDPASAGDYRHDGTPAPHPADNVENGFVLAHHGEIAAGDIAQGHAGMGALQPSTEARIDADHPVNLTLVSDHDVAQAPGMFGLPQIVIETLLRRQHLDVGVHHFARGADEEHVRVTRLWDGPAAAHKLQAVDGLAREHSARADADRYRHDQRHHDAVVEGHLKDHCDSGHDRAGPAAHHRAHADHGKGGNAEMN